jgi:transmembrane sensor
MADIHRLPNIKEVEREASEWIARLDADDVSAEDRTRFDVWLHSHPLHARAYEDLLGTWRQLAEAAPLTRAAAAAGSPDPPRAWHRPQRWRQFAMAMSGIVAAVLLGSYLHSLTTAATFQTARGERATIALPDGSTLRLNSDSRARVDYSLRSRVIYLERGEAFFAVAREVKRPFWVTTGGSWVRAVGTAFGVYLNREGVRVTVHEGTVKLGSADQLLPTAFSEGTLKKASAVLTAGEQADLQGAVTTTRKLSAAELARAAAWQDGWLHVANENLCDVIAELNRYTPRQLILEDTQLCSLSVGGAFQADPRGAEALLSMLEQNFGARVRRDVDGAYIQGPTNHSAPSQQ